MISLNHRYRPFLPPDLGYLSVRVSVSLLAMLYLYVNNSQTVVGRWRWWWWSLAVVVVVGGGSQRR